MKAHALKCLIILPTLLSAQLSDAQTTQSGWLEQVEGHRGELIGAQVKSISTDQTGHYQVVTVAIPKTAVNDPNDIEEIIVVAKRPEPRRPVSNVDYHWVRDYDRDHYGLIIRLGENTDWPIRLYMSSGAETEPYRP